jgi:hypothetical protein
MNFMSIKKANKRRESLIDALEPRRLFSTYYVSPTGNDSNPGTSASAPWQTVAKVDGTTFLPGDSILFQRGAQFHEALAANSSGSATAAITYGAYGDTTLPDPEFFGSDVLDPSAFTLVSGTTYSIPSATALSWAYDNHQFTHESEDALTAAGTPSSDPATNISYVENNSETFYYDTASTTLYLNVGGSLTGHVITATTRPIEIAANAASYVTFQNLLVTETASDANTFAIDDAGASTNDQVLDCTATLTGKHAFGAIDTTNFLGKDLLTNLTAPDLGFGAASAYVAFSDQTRVGDTSSWIDCTYTNPNGAYPAFISHGDPNSIGSILVQNIVSDGTYNNALFIESTSSSEVVTVDGGETGSASEIDTNNSVVNGMTFDQPGAGVEFAGNNDVIQNSLFTNLSPNVDAGSNGGVILAGTGDVARFNTFSFTGGPAVDIKPATGITASDADIYGNIFDCTQAILLYYSGTGTQTSNDNLFAPGASEGMFTGLVSASYTFQQWQAMGYDADSVVAAPEFVDGATGNYQLSDTSAALDLYTGIPDTTITTINTDFAGNPRPYGAGYDAGAFELQSPKVTGVPATLSGPATVAEPATGAASLTFTVTLAAASTSPLTVDYSTQDGTAVAGTDYVAATGTLTFAPGITTQTFTVQVTPDLPNQNNTAFTVALSNPSAGLGLAVASVPVTITNLVVVPAVLSGPAMVNEPISGNSDATYTVTLAAPSTTSVTVSYATIAGTAVSGTDFTAEAGTLTFSAGQTTQTFTVPILADDAVQTDTDFTVTLSALDAGVSVSPNTSTVATDIVNAPVTIESLNTHHQYKFTDAANVPATIQLSGPGSASIVFAGTAGTGQNAAQIVLTGTTAASTLSIISRATTTVGDILVSGSLRVLSAPKVNLSGRIDIAGTANSITVASMTGGSELQISGSTVPVALSLGRVTDATVESSSVIRSLVATQWISDGNAASSITAPAISRLSSRGSFAADMNVAGLINSASLGAILSGTWTVGSANSITAASVAGDWSATFGGTLRTFTTLANFAGALTAPTVTSLNVHGSLASATLEVAALGRLNVNGAITSSTITGTNILALTAGSITGSTVLAGIASASALPIATLGSGTIGSFTIRSAAGFSSTIVATDVIKAVNLKAVNSSNGGVAFGFDAQTYATFSIGPKFHWNNHKPAATLTAAATGDFDILVG